MSLSSAAHFADKACEYGLSALTIEKLKAKGYTTMGALAFSCSAMPGAEGITNETFDKYLATPVLGEDPGGGHVELAGLRRLYFEA